MNTLIPHGMNTWIALQSRVNKIGPRWRNNKSCHFPCILGIVLSINVFRTGQAVCQLHVQTQGPIYGRNRVYVCQVTVHWGDDLCMWAQVQLYVCTHTHTHTHTHTQTHTHAHTHMRTHTHTHTHTRSSWFYPLWLFQRCIVSVLDEWKRNPGNI